MLVLPTQHDMAHRLRARSELLLRGLDMLEQDLNLARKRAQARPRAPKPRGDRGQSFDDMLDSIPGDAAE